METASSLVLFDGVCNLCNGAVQFIINRDPGGRFAFASLQSAAGQARLRQFAGAWRLLYALMVIPRPVRDWAYGLVARNRYRLFGRRDACLIPTPELKAKFLD
jgi:predicted DCC family thiol-disulfide oxidoreductase YuxK